MLLSEHIFNIRLRRDGELLPVLVLLHPALKGGGGDAFLPLTQAYNKSSRPGDDVCTC